MEKNNHTSVKNYQSEETIRMLYKKAFNKNPSSINISILSGGLKNAVYLIQDGEEKVVLKIAPADESKMISADRNILWWENKMLQKMEELRFPSPRALYYDDSCELCKAPFIFMSYLEGRNYLEAKKDLTNDEKANIEYQLGKLSAQICSIKSEQFFLPSYPSKRFKDNYEFVKFLFELLLEDVSSNKIDLGENNYNMIFKILEEKQDSLRNVQEISLAHTDIWDGNVLVNDGNISGIVDFSDLYCCDELMTFYFHTIDGITSESFLKGFNNKKLTYDEKVRIEIYRMYVILKMIVDCELKEYGKFDWMYENLNNRIHTLRKITG